MPDPSPDDFVQVYDKRTGDKLPNAVPRHWLDQPWATHLAELPSNGRYAKPGPQHAPQITDDPAKAAAVDTTPTLDAPAPEPAPTTDAKEA